MRSVQPDDYQTVPRPVAVMAKDFPSGATTGRHRHVRDQLLYATTGLMVAVMENGTWVVPAGYALLIPSGVHHEVSMHGAVAMRTAYLGEQALILSSQCRVLSVSALLDAALVALSEEPILYHEGGRGGHLAALVIEEIARAPMSPFALPLPQDDRLRKLCGALIEAPGLSLDIDAWSNRIGVSRRTLTRRFLEETGMSFGAWRRRLRVLAAMVKRAEGASVGKIAADMGYVSQRAFQAMVKRTLAEHADGETPLRI